MSTGGWVLVLFLITPHSNISPAMTSIPGFSSGMECNKQGMEIQRHVKGDTQMQYLCVQPK